MFVLPLAKEKGHFVMVSQAQKKTIMLTFLEQFKDKGPQATPYLVFTLYDELLQFKKLGFIRGDVVALKVLTQSDANWLMNELLNFYLTSDFEKVSQFNHDPNNFNFEAYISESLERQRALRKD